MNIGIPKERMNQEHRVAINPAGVTTLVHEGHKVYIERGAGVESGISDKEYEDEGAVICDVDKVWECDMVMKVKEPLKEEFKYFREGLIIYAYFHLANDLELAKELLDNKVTAIAYETIGTPGHLPLLMPMSQVAGRMAPILGAQYLQKQNGGSGVLLGGVPGVERGTVTIIGGGNVGQNATKMAIGLGAKVILMGRNPEKLRELDDLFGLDVQTLVSNKKNIAESVAKSDMVIGAVLLPGGAKAPTLVTREMVKSMKPGSVIIDVAVDQGGIFETIDRITTHDKPVYVEEGVTHYAVANIPGAVPHTSTHALTNSTIRYASKIARGDFKRIIEKDEDLRNGFNTFKGKMTAKQVAKDLGLEYTDIKELI